MRKLFISMASIAGICTTAAAQHVYQIRADSVRIYNVCDTAELIIENRTRGVSGYLFNKGNGRTEFKKISLVQVGGSRLAISGQDTIDLAQMSGVGGIDTIYRSGDNIRYVKQGVMRELYAPLAPADSALTLQRVTDRGNTTTRDIVFNHSNGNPSNGLLWGYNTDYWKIFVESPQDTPAGNMIFEANDNGDEGWIFRSKTPGAAYDILALKRDFSSFRGFLAQRPFSLNPENNTVNQFWNAMGGAMVTPDPEFRLGNNGLSVYNNAQGSSAVTVERTNTPLTAAVPNASGYYLKVTSAPGAAPQTTLPGLGGVALRYTSAENKVYVTRIKALIPEGYTLKPAANVFGTNSMSYWLTSDKGTGKWEDYIHVYAAGYTGTFNDICYYYLDGPMQTTTWYVGYFDFKIPTAAPWPDNIQQDLKSGRPLALWLKNDSLKLDQGDGQSFRLLNPNGMIQIGAQNSSYMHFTTDRENFYFSKPILAVNKLAIYNSGQSNASTTYLAQTEGRINGSPILTEAGGGGNFLRKLADTAQAGPLWMKGAIKTDGALITKIAHGYAGIQLRNVADVIRFGFGLSTGENGANAGSDFHIWRFKDTGDSSNVAMRISRVNGDVWFPGIVSSSSGSKITGDGNGSSFYSYLGFYDNNNQRYGYVGKGRRGSTEMQIHSDSGNVTIVPKGGNQLVVSSNYMTYYGGAFYLDNPATNTLHFSQGTNGVQPPAFGTRSVGTKIVLFPNQTATSVDYGIGIDTSTLWNSVPRNNMFFKWYAGTTSIATLAGTGNLTTTGNMTATAFYQSSLRSLKKDIKPFTASALEVLGKAQVRSFIFKSDSTGHRNIGFIADEVPGEMATPARNGVDQASTVGLLVKAVQELKSEKTELESKLKAMESKNDSLEARLKAIEDLMRKAKP